MNLAQATLSPGTDGHPLGTDASDYDVLRRLMVAGQISLEVGIAAALLATLVGVLWGAIAGYFGSWLTTPRPVRGEAVSVRVREYVRTMKVMGGNGIRAATGSSPDAVGDRHGERHVSSRRDRPRRRAQLPGARIPPPRRTHGGMLSDCVQTSMTDTGG